MRSLPTRLPLLALAALLFSSCILVSSCVFVRVEGDLPESDWITDVVHGGTAEPASFDHGRADLSLFGSLAGINASLEMKFSCAPEDVTAYLDGVVSELQVSLREERDAEILRVTSDSPRKRRIEYDGEDGRGVVDVRVRELDGGGRFDYRLEIELRE